MLTTLRLSYKTWRESRVRFSLFALLMVFFCMRSIVRARTHFPPPELPQLTYGMWVWANNYGNLSPVLFVIMCLMLALGGLQRERAYGTTSFTLSLPVTRFQLLAARAGMGVLQVAVLALIPAILSPALSPPIAAQEYPAAQSFQYALLYLTWGLLAFGIGLLLSTLVGGEFTTPVLCVFAPIIYRVLIDNSSLARSSVSYGYFMGGGLAGFDPHTDFLTGPFPWAVTLLLLAVAAGIVVAAAKVTRRQDF